jgi:DNA-binding NtrC family response regulator
MSLNIFGGEMKSILFVDDDENLLSSLKRILHKKKDIWAMDFIVSSKEAIALLHLKEYHCVVVDYKMPEVNGLELLKIVAEHNPDTKRVLLSGQVDEDVFAKAKSITHAYLPKPCEPEELLKTLEELLP